MKIKSIIFILFLSACQGEDLIDDAFNDAGSDFRVKQDFGNKNDTLENYYDSGNLTLGKQYLRNKHFKLLVPFECKDYCINSCKKSCYPNHDTAVGCVDTCIHIFEKTLRNCTVEVRWNNVCEYMTYLSNVLPCTEDKIISWFFMENLKDGNCL